MVAVGDVGGRHTLKHQAKGVHRAFAGDPPDAMVAVLLVGEVIKRRRRHCEGHERVDRRLVAIGEEDGPGLGMGGTDMLDAVSLLGRARLFVAADGPVLVVVDGSSADQPDLLVVCGREAPDVVAGLLVV